MDGWDQKPSGWNDFDCRKWSSADVINIDLDGYPSKDCSKTGYNHNYILVLAGGLDDLGRNHPWVKDRLDVAFRLYQQKPRNIIILGGGTYHKPPYLNKEGYAIHESTMGAQYLLDLGVSPKHIFREWGSYDTIANGYFSLVNFVIPFKLFSEDLLIITSDFHMERSQLIFSWIYSLWRSHSMPRLTFLEVSTKSLDQNIIIPRVKRELNSVKNLQKTILKIDTWDKFIKWFYGEHKAYNCQFDIEKEQIDPIARSSY